MCKIAGQQLIRRDCIKSKVGAIMETVGSSLTEKENAISQETENVCIRKSELSIILPVSNEAKYLKEAVNETVSWASKISNDWHIIIAEDGSTDGSTELAYQLEEERKNIIVLHGDTKLGRGKAVKRAMRLSNAEIYAYFDVDLAANMIFFPMLINKVKMGYDIVTGSRYIKGAAFTRPLLRLFASKVYNWMVRFLFRSQVYDHQCGFKAFSRRVRDELLDDCKSDDWLWDTEIIVLGIRSNFKIHEFPVEWKERRFKKTPLKRLITDVKVHGIGLLKLLGRVNSRGGSIRSQKIGHLSQ